MSNLVRIFLLIFIVLTSVAVPIAGAQEQNTALPFIIVIDNGFTDGSDIIDGKFVITDARRAPIDSMSCNYWVGRLLMYKQDYKRLFKIKQDTSLRIFFRFSFRKLDLGTDFPYSINFLPWQINKDYIYLRVFNSFDKENQQKYFFKEGQTYLYQIFTPGYMTILYRK